jgi:peptidoglycan hydrolase CwlO-like protein
MKALLSLVLAIALIGGIYIASTSGCGARAQVAGDKILQKIDGWLGELDVKRKEIANSVERLDAAIDRNHKAKVSAEVRLEEIDRKIEPVQSTIGRIKQALIVINPHLDATAEVEINGKMMSPEKIQEVANQLLDQHESMSSQLGALKATRETYQRTLDLLSREYETSTKQMTSLKKKLDEIDIKKKALDDMKTAQTILGESGSISDEFNDLEAEITDLFLEVETGMRVESEKVAQREQALEESSSTLDDILNEVESVDETRARIEAILSGSGG